MSKNGISIWKFGAIRNIALADKEDVAMPEFSDFDYIKDDQQVKSIQKDGSCTIIGLLNNAVPVLCFDKPIENKIFIYEHILSNPLVPVASTFSSLRKILDRIVEVWKSYPNQNTITITDESIADIKSVISEIERENPYCDITFWIEEGFPGLSIGFDLK